MKFTKITDDHFEKCSCDEMIDILDDKTKEMILENLEDYKLNNIMCIADCESPIERMFSIAINHLLKSYEIRQIKKGVNIADVNNQEIVECSGNKYRVDFLIPVIYDKLNTHHFFIVECDGHDFHEKTKEQVAKDKKRERDLIATGCTVIRFSGSEVYKEPYRCAKEVIDMIFNYKK